MPTKPNVLWIMSDQHSPRIAGFAGDPDARTENLDALAALLESGDVKVVIDRVYPLSEAANAVAHMLGHHAIGKVVIAV